jgi:hypothetical protein
MLALRVAGASYQQIATAVSVPVTAVGKDLARALEDQRKASQAEEPLRPTLELERLTIMERACMAVLQNASAADADPALALAATDRLLRISERRASVVQPEPVTGDELRRRRLGRTP